jgi:hypothetical protein
MPIPNLYARRWWSGAAFGRSDIGYEKAEPVGIRIGNEISPDNGGSFGRFAGSFSIYANKLLI